MVIRTEVDFQNIIASVFFRQFLRQFGSGGVSLRQFSSLFFTLEGYRTNCPPEIKRNC
jgi:hypothetical protein